MIAYYVHHLSPFIVRFWGNFGLHWYGFGYVLGFVLGYWLYLWLARRGYSKLPPAQVPDLITGTCFFGVLVGGRLGYMLFYGLQDVLHDPLRILRVWEGGMASHGGVIGVALFSLWYARKHKVAWLDIGDNLCVVAPIGIFFGRCANFINGELFGRIANVPWAIQFPKELYDLPALADRAVDVCSTKIDPRLSSPEAIVEAARSSPAVREALSHILNPRHPSQIYEAGMEGLALFLALFLLRTRLRLPEGVVTGAFFILYACVRIFGEEFREPDVGIPFTLGLTRGQFLSAFMLAIGAVFIIAAYWRNRPSAHPGAGAE